MVFLLGLPWGVETGLIKSCLVGVLGYSAVGDLISLSPWEAGNMFVIKLAIAARNAEWASI